MNKHTVALDHISVPVRRFAAARAFYESALGAIGMKVNMEMADAFGMGAQREKVFWIVKDRKASGGGHYALRVEQREQVDAFHRAAIEAGATDHGAPGPRPDYGPSYYAAFVMDAEGNNIEVVCYTRSPRRPKRTGARRRPATTRSRGVRRRRART